MHSSLATFADPPTEFSVLPFWFWNDDLDADEIRRQIADFEEHGVYGFIIHPRVGLPRSLGWMSEALLEFYDVALDEAAQRGMQVFLYDEGMYPSGSSAGQVVEENPAYQTRCLEARALAAGEEPTLRADETLVAVVNRRTGERLAVIDRKMDAYIRGLHYIDGGPAEDEPLAGDLLNPDAVACFIRLVYDKFYQRFSRHFGGLIPAIFTDEPSPVGKPRERGVWPGTTGILAHVNRLLGYDFTPHLPALWHDDEPDAARYRADYERAIALRMEETWYAQLYDWCTEHGIALTGHPAKADDLGAERYFHIPGQDLVWRWVLPDDPTALEGAQSTQGKCGSSAMIHTGRRCNANELCGAYGHGLTWEEMNWLTGALRAARTCSSRTPSTTACAASAATNARRTWGRTALGGGATRATRTVAAASAGSTPTASISAQWPSSARWIGCPGNRPRSSSSTSATSTTWKSAICGRMPPWTRAASTWPVCTIRRW